MKKNQSGFTLVEILIVVTIIGILAALVSLRFSNSRDISYENTHKAQRTMINQQIQLFFFHNNIYPTDMTAASWKTTTSETTDYWPDGIPQVCEMAEDWLIDSSLHRVDMDGKHVGHE